MQVVVPHGVYGILNLPNKSGLAPEDIISGLACGGCCVIQLRAKEASTTERMKWTQKLGPRCRELGVGLWVNDDVDVVCWNIPGVVGVHLGQDDLRNHNPWALRKRLRDRGLGLGISTHNKKQVHDALRVEPDYLGFGPVFSTTSKVHSDPVTGVEQLFEICQFSRVPIVAIGGISLLNVRKCKVAGAQSVAMIAALEADSVNQMHLQCRQLTNAWHQSSPV